MVAPGVRVGVLLLLLGVLGLSGCAVPRWPVSGEVSSPYGIRVRGAILPSIHRGVDIRVPVGTEVRTMAPGRVRFAGTMRGYGEVIWIDHGPDLLTIYAHLSRLGVTAGEEVGNGQVIGWSGRSGSATGPHLHFEVWRWGRPHDPVPLLGGFP
jgi:murein DD-endopeptidase MepM/ murein hydrolase activator NlpD